MLRSLLLVSSATILGSTEAALTCSGLAHRMPNSHIQVPLGIIRQPRNMQVEVCMLDLTMPAPALGRSYCSKYTCESTM